MWLWLPLIRTVLKFTLCHVNIYIYGKQKAKKEDCWKPRKSFYFDFIFKVCFVGVLLFIA